MWSQGRPTSATHSSRVESRQASPQSNVCPRTSTHRRSSEAQMSKSETIQSGAADEGQVFWKLEGAGNDFIFFLDDPIFSKGARGIPDLAIKLCNRQSGIGADGMVILTTGGPSCRWDFFNADGSRAEMCGNAARCVAALADKLWGHQELTLRASATNIVLSVDVKRTKTLRRKMYSGQFKLPQVLQEDFVLDKMFKGIRVDSGVPHFVIFHDNFEPNAEWAKVSKQIQNEGLFSPNGTNVTWVNFRDTRSKTDNFDKEIFLEGVTFERGVNNFTQACGTGALAAAAALRSRFGLKEQGYCVKMPGGDLYIELRDQDGVAIQSGPARVVFCGRVDLEL